MHEDNNALLVLYSTWKHNAWIHLLIVLTSFSIEKKSHLNI